MEVKVKYSGEYPCLCMGILTVTINETEYKFPRYCMESGGSCYFSCDYTEANATKGPWKITSWPKNFPEEYKEATLEAVNNKIPWGCCGGCL